MLVEDTVSSGELRIVTYRQRRRASTASLLRNWLAGHVASATRKESQLEPEGRTEGSRELLEGLDTEPRHFEGVGGYREEGDRFGLMEVRQGALRLRVFKTSAFRCKAPSGFCRSRAPEISGGLRQRGRRLMQKCQATARARPHLLRARSRINHSAEPRVFMQALSTYT